MQDNTAKKYPDELRLIKALVQIDGTILEMQFITNNLEWSAYSICDLYLARWAIEMFFKEIKQTLQLADFLGTSANAIKWQFLTALLTYLLLRLVG
jgi:IS4 transposase